MENLTMWAENLIENYPPFVFMIGQSEIMANDWLIYYID